MIRLIKFNEVINEKSCDTWNLSKPYYITLNKPEICKKDNEFVFNLENIIGMCKIKIKVKENDGIYISELKKVMNKEKYFENISNIKHIITGYFENRVLKNGQLICFYII